MKPTAVVVAPTVPARQGGNSGLPEAKVRPAPFGARRDGARLRTVPGRARASGSRLGPTVIPTDVTET